MMTLMRVGWGKENPAFRQLFTSQFVPGGTKEQADWFNGLQRITVSAEMAARISKATGEIDVSPLLVPSASSWSKPWHSWPNRRITRRLMYRGTPTEANWAPRGSSSRATVPPSLLLRADQVIE